MTVNEQPMVDQSVVWEDTGSMGRDRVFFLNGLTLSTYIVRAPALKDAYISPTDSSGSPASVALAALADAVLRRR